MKTKLTAGFLVLILLSLFCWGACGQEVIGGPLTNAANGHLYYLLSPSTWTDAEAKAVTLEGHLVTVNDEGENGWVCTNFSSFGGTNSFLWIGFSDELEEGTFVWSSGTPVSYTRWFDGEPNDANENEDYAYIDTPDSERFKAWNDSINSPLDDNGINPRGVVEVVLPTPQIFLGPLSQTIASGNDVDLSASVEGAPDLKYQWWSGGPIDGATNEVLTLTNVQFATAGTYFVVVTNLYGAATSAPAVLMVTNQMPVFAEQPQMTFVQPGGDATLSVTATGSKPMVFQWLFGGSPVSGATNSAYTILAANTNTTGNYAVVISNAFGSVMSSNAMVAIGGYLSMSDNFDAGIDYSQWSAFGGAAIATNYGGFISAPNALTFNGNGSRFATTRPINTLGQTVVEFAIRLSGGGPLNWERVDSFEKRVILEYSVDGGTNWVEMNNYSTTSWGMDFEELPDEAKSPATLLRWRQLSNSGNGFDNWALDDVRVGPPRLPVITVQPMDYFTQGGEDSYFSVTATGSPELQYQWQFNGHNLDETGPIMIRQSVGPGDAGHYRVRVSNPYGDVYSSNVTLVVTGVPPSIIWQPRDVAAMEATQTNFMVVATGSQELFYRWRRDGTDIDGETGNSLSIDVESDQVGIYSVVVTNYYGAVTSAPVSLTVIPLTLPEIIGGPIVNPMNGHYYYILSPSRWTEAEEKAVTMGGHLVTINDADEEDWVFNTFGSFEGVNSYLWIGFNDHAQEGTFVWSSGETPEFTKWWSGEPNNFGDEDYAYIDTPGFLQQNTWNDVPNAINSGVPARGVVELLAPYGEVAFPRLEVFSVGTNILLRWPTSASDFNLQMSDLEAVSSGWTNISPETATNGGYIETILPAVPDKKFFRLKYP